MSRLGVIVPYPARAVFFALSALATAGLLLSNSNSVLTPGASFALSTMSGGSVNGWTSLTRKEGAVTRILSVADAALYRRIFQLQEQNDFANADAAMARLTNRSLVGHVLADRYLKNKAYKTKYPELKQWLANYADHPEADRIFQMARTSEKKSKGKLPKPVIADLGSHRASRRERAAMTRPPAPNKATPAQRISFAKIEPKGDLAAEFFYKGKPRQAFTLASAKATGPSRRDRVANWTAGLAAWRLGKFAAASKHFEMVAHASDGDDWSRSAGAFWAARAHLANKKPERVNKLLLMAANYPRTFYGLLATRALGRTPGFNWRVPDLDQATMAPLTSLPAGRRALGLMQIGQSARAEEELRPLSKKADRALTQAIFAVASHANMPEFLFRMGNRLRDRDGRPFDAALYPLPQWQPSEGYSVDRAVLFAIMRQESQFKAEAISPAGARGLMQIMPPTASFVTGDKSFKSSKDTRLFKPELNVSLAQKYILQLLDEREIKGDLFRLTAAYNGGIGNVVRWRNNLPDDPLLFIESISFRETRGYVERVLSNVWMYRLRLGQPTPSLDALAAGEWPTYRPLEHRTEMTLASLNE